MTRNKRKHEGSSTIVKSETSSDWRFQQTNEVFHDLHVHLGTFGLAFPTNSEESYLISVLHKPKQAETVQVSPVEIGHVSTCLDVPQMERVKILVDSGANSTIILRKHVKKLRQIESAATLWQMQGGKFTTYKLCEVQFSLPAFHESRLINWNIQVATATNSSNYWIT